MPLPILHHIWSGRNYFSCIFYISKFKHDDWLSRALLHCHWLIGAGEFKKWAQIWCQHRTEKWSLNRYLFILAPNGCLPCYLKNDRYTLWIFAQKWGRQNMFLEKIYFALWMYTKAGEKEFLKSYIRLSSCHLTSTGRPAHSAGINGAV